MKYNQSLYQDHESKKTPLGFFRSNRPAVRHDADNRPSACQFHKLLMPVQQDAHLLATTTLTQVPGLNLRKPSGLRGDGLARGLRATAGGGRGHSFVAGLCKPRS